MSGKVRKHDGGWMLLPFSKGEPKGTPTLFNIQSSASAIQQFEQPTEQGGEEIEGEFQRHAEINVADEGNERDVADSRKAAA